MSASPYQRVTFRGHTLNRRTAAMIQQAEDVILGFHLDIAQGSYNTTVKQSAGTHNGGGAVDADWPGGSRTKALAVQRALREVGFASWVRDPIPGVWGPHVHSIAIGDKEMSDAARKQVQDYYASLNGLAGHARDTSWKPNPIPVFSYPLGVCHLDVAVAQARAKHKSSRPAVKLIQSALNTKTGTHLRTDGIYGNQTRAALARYEKQVGGDGDGIPGRFALSLLGLARFRVA